MTNETETTETTNPDEYNGWTNRETWAASLHLSNDFGLYEMVNGWANEARREALEIAERDRFGMFAEGLETVESRTVAELADTIRDYIDGIRADMQDNECYSETERMMVLEIGSEWRVDWLQLAENWLDGFEFDTDEA